MGNVLETYVFSPEANEGEIAMLPRLFSGLLHPLIHLGHGPEFALPGLAAEGKHVSKVMSRTIYVWIPKGLAMAAVTKNICGGLFPPIFFKKKGPLGPGLHALSIVARLLKDPELACGKAADMAASSRFRDGIRRSGDRLHEHFSEWSAEGNFTEKYEELVWMVCSLYGFSGWRKGEGFQANFFM